MARFPQRDRASLLITNCKTVFTGVAMNIQPSPMDLTTVAACQSWGNFTGSSTANLQACLTAASIYFLRMTGRGPRNWQNVAQNPFNQPVTYQETYDGISGQKLFLRNFPINSVSSLTIGGNVVAQSTSATSPGWIIDDQGRAITMRFGGGVSPDTFQYYARYGNGGSAGYGGGRNIRPFAAPVQGIHVNYTAGFLSYIYDEIYTAIPAWQPNTAYATGAQVSDGIFIQTASNSATSGALAPPWSANKGQPTKDGTTLIWTNTGIANAPNTIIIQSEVAVLTDGGVKYFSNGSPLESVNIAPLIGQYSLLAAGVYLFNAADAGKQMDVTYTKAGTPADIVLAVMQLVSLNYKRRDWIGLRSVAMKDVGSTSYTLAIDPVIQECIRNYTRANLSS